MNALIINRDTGNEADKGWYQIEVTGEHPAGKYGMQVIDGEAINSIVSIFNRLAAEAGDDFPGLLVDADHLSLDEDKQTEAYGWLKEVRERDGQLEGRIEWTDLGETAIKNKRYKFFSTEYLPRDLKKIGDGRVRPLVLGGLALTNRPNNRGGRPISNREDDPRPGEPNETENMKAIALKLGLPEDASEAAILEAITKLNSAKTDAEETVMNRDKELKLYRESEADAELEKYASRIGKDEGVKNHFREQLITNREATVKILEAMPEKDGKEDDTTPLRNRSKSPVPVTDADPRKDAEAEKKAATIRNRARAIEKAEGLPYNQAFAAAKREIG